MRYWRLRGQIAVVLLIFAAFLIGGGLLLADGDAAAIGAALGVGTLVFGARDVWRGLRDLLRGSPRGRDSAPAPGVAPTESPSRVESVAQAPHLLRNPWIVDGDTLDDRATGIRYRLENIDAPETDDRAACDAERYMGNRAKWEAVKIVRGAQSVIAAPTGKIDAYGRVVARITVDGHDLGDVMIASGLALPWNGQRESWCGKGGNLHTLSMTHFKRPICHACAVSRSA